MPTLEEINGGGGDQAAPLAFPGGGEGMAFNPGNAEAAHLAFRGSAFGNQQGPVATPPHIIAGQQGPMPPQPGGDGDGLGPGREAFRNSLKQFFGRS